MLLFLLSKQQQPSASPNLATRNLVNRAHSHLLSMIPLTKILINQIGLVDCSLVLRWLADQTGINKVHPSVCHSIKKHSRQCLSLNTTAESTATQEKKERKQPGKSLHQNIISIFSVSIFFASAKHSTQTETKGAEASLQRGTRWQQLKGRGFNIPGRSPGAAPLVIKSSRVSQPLQPLGLPRS